MFPPKFTWKKKKLSFGSSRISRDSIFQPPTDWEGSDFYHNRTNSILQQLKRTSNSHRRTKGQILTLLKKENKSLREQIPKGHLYIQVTVGSKNGFFCLAEMGQKTLWVSAF
jgi:hypothetical protein